MSLYAFNITYEVPTIIQNAGIVCVLNPTETRLTPTYQTKSLEFSFPIGIRTHVYAFKKCSFHKREPDFPLVTINNGRDTVTIYVQLSRVSYSRPYYMYIALTEQETMLPTMLTCIYRGDSKLLEVINHCVRIYVMIQRVFI